MIAILCPTRGRPEGAKRMWDSATATSDENVRVCLGISNEDKSAYYALLGEPTIDDGDDCPDGMPTVHKWNKLAAMALKYRPDTKLFMLGSDDMVFATPGWDEALLDHYEKLENKIHVCHIQDSRDPDGTPHPIVTREYISAMGYFLPPIFLHWFVDSWTVAIARANGCYTHLKDYLLIHDKPSDRGQPDETHSRIRRMGWHDRDQAVNDSCQHFLGLEKVRLRGMIEALNEGRKIIPDYNFEVRFEKKTVQ